MKTVKLWVHKKKITDIHVGAILINPKEFSYLNVGDVVEIYHPEEEFSRLLLQIESLGDDFQQKDTVSIEQAIATAFQLKTYQNVIVNKVDPKAVTLDLVEVQFKDQYFSRSDMHRIRNSMIGTCVYLNKKIVFSEMRTQVNELWAKGEKVTCGVISEDTRVVFRSSTAVVQIFIQMSSEMWDFDINGDLYFEKAVNGFLTDLYEKWKEQNCCHDVTIVMFSRTFYDAQSRDEFPHYMQECLQQDYSGRFYEDFYRVVVQNERYMYDEWTGTLKQLRKIFHEYKKKVLHYHKRPGYKVPKAYNSTAAQGNFLETLNMTLNLFEQFYFDRNFDRTGKVAVVITPGAGVFEVNRELTNITKQRTIDCGVGSDLVCMGEQPLHAAPLFKLQSRNAGSRLDFGDDYNIPHWMNHRPSRKSESHLKTLYLIGAMTSYTELLNLQYYINGDFYTSKNQIQFYSNKTFVPRIKIPPEVLDRKKSKEPVSEKNLTYEAEEDDFPLIDYDEYDAQVFKLPQKAQVGFGTGSLKRTKDHSSKRKQHPQTFTEAKAYHSPRTRRVSDDTMITEKMIDRKTIFDSSPAVSINSQSGSTDDLSSSLGCFSLSGEKGINREILDSEDIGRRQIVGSAGSPEGHRKLHQYIKHHRAALINPFAPSKMQFKMTSNRRRWVHAFPMDPHGAAVQTHHVHTYQYQEQFDNEEEMFEQTPEVVEAAHLAMQARKEQGNVQTFSSMKESLSSDDSSSLKHASPGHRQNDCVRSSSQRERQQRSYLWGPTGEQEWSPELTTGLDWRPLDDHEISETESRLIKPILTDDVENTFCAGISVDWKSLTMPASLPITTDYLPDQTSLHNDYVVSDYSLLPDDVNSDYYMNPPKHDDEKYYRKQPLSHREVFNELISQRLAQGFQLIVSNKSLVHRPELTSSPSIVSQRSILSSSPQVTQVLSAGLIRARPREEQSEEMYLSIGRIFHKLSLMGPTITVTRYRPRHPNTPLCYSYKYRFQCPDSPSYNVSWSEFRNEKLENYNWNYLDQYICTRGEGDYGLMESLKYWRSTFYILPCNNPATKQIIEGHSSRCDIYQEKSLSDLKQLMTGFSRYLEILNKMKRTAVTRHVSCKHTQFIEKNPTGIPQPDPRPEEEVLSISSPTAKIIKWMTDPQCGIPMLPKQHGLPQNCFISGEVVDWCYYHVKGVKGVRTAMEMLQRVLDDGYIIHASGNTKHKMIYGFYIYCFLNKDKTKEEETIQYNPLFQNDWCEVTFVTANSEEEEQKFYISEALNSSCSSLKNPDDWKVETGLLDSCQTWGQQSATLHHKYVNVEVDPQNKSDRPEWATARYHAYFSPLCAFELQVQWMVSTGCIFGELVNNWARKAGACMFHLIPVPVDPFALPTAPESDPLRGPIYISLNINSIENLEGRMFPGYDEDERQEKMRLFQESIIKRFGFMQAGLRKVNKVKSHFSSLMNQSEEYQHYVHCTGGMFVIIEDGHNTPPSPPPVNQEMKLANPLASRSSSKELRSSSSGSLGKKSSTELRKDYIARQASEILNSEEVEKESKIGFLWSWNFMSSRKWRSSNTGDEHFQDTVLRDFRLFCADHEERLTQFWLDYRDRYI